MLVKNIISLLFLFFALNFSSLLAKDVENDSLNIIYSSGANPYLVKVSDTTLSNLIYYQPNSSFTNFAFNTGAIGQAFSPTYLFYNRTNENIFRAFSDYFIGTDSIKYYYTTRPYTEFYYTQGLTKEHLPSVFHTQQINSQLGITLNYRAISSDGYYTHQESRGQTFSSSIRFKNIKGNFLSNFSFAYNSLNVNENGGLTASAKEDFIAGLSTSNRLELGVNLSSALNLMKHRALAWDNYYYLTAQKDSLLKPKYSVGIFNEFNISSSSSLFKMTKSTDVQNVFFNAIYLDSTQTRDSVWLNRLEDVIGFTLGKWNDKQYVPILKLGYKQQLNNVNEMNSGFVNAEWQSVKESNFLKTLFQYGVIGRRKGDIKAIVEYQKILKSKNLFYLQLFYGDQKVSYFDNYFISNHHTWNNNFENIQQAAVSGKFYFHPLRLTLDAGYQSISNFVLFDINSNIKQIKEQQNTVFVSLFHTVKNKWIRSRSFIRYQNASESVRVPELMARQEIAFLINRNAIHAEIGVVGTYVSNFYANAYNPSLRDYYLQNKINTGGIILVDFFAALKVGSAKIFFKADHCNAGLLGYNYELTPYYPLSDLTFKLGIKWTFWN